MAGHSLTPLCAWPGYKDPHWDLQRLAERPCPFCRSQGPPRFKRPDQLLVRLCSGCGLYYISPSPPPADIERFYQSYYTSYNTRFPGRLVRWSWRQQRPQDDWRVCRLAALQNWRDQAVLDVGFGHGQMLRAFRQLGARVSGIDLNPAAVAYVRQTLGIPDVSCSSLENHPRRDYDLILMFDLIEHPLEPLPLLRRAVQLLKGGGYLALWTPNATAAGQRPDPLLFRLDLDHMQYLNEPSFRWLAAALDLKLLHLEALGEKHPEWVDPWEPLPSRLARLARGAKLAIKGLPGFPLVDRLRRALLHKPAHDLRQGDYHLFCILQKHL